MAFDGPHAADFRNVVSLNQAYLALLQRDKTLRAGLSGLSDPLQRRITALSCNEIARLSATPFLLFSFRETDDLHWNRILAGKSCRDLFRATLSGDVDTLVSAAIGFIWQLAQHNPYALRLVCGATLYWCERIAEQTFFVLLEAVRDFGEVPLIRIANQREVWRKLLHAGISKDPAIRRAAHMSAMQAVLTHTPLAANGPWARAARTTRIPSRLVAESGGNSPGKSRSG